MIINKTTLHLSHSWIHPDWQFGVDTLAFLVIILRYQLVVSWIYYRMVEGFTVLSFPPRLTSYQPLGAWVMKQELLLAL